MNNHFKKPVHQTGKKKKKPSPNANMHLIITCKMRKLNIRAIFKLLEKQKKKGNPIDIPNQVGSLSQDLALPSQ